jgi:predicted secreted protein
MKFVILVTIIWIVVFFLFLPVGNTMPERVQRGNADSAPEKHHIALKLLISLVVSIILAICYKMLLGKFPMLYNLIKY